jgi:hypothetical protein
MTKINDLPLPKPDREEELQRGLWLIQEWNLPKGVVLQKEIDNSKQLASRLGITPPSHMISTKYVLAPKDDRTYYIPEEVFMYFLLVAGRLD